MGHQLRRPRMGTKWRRGLLTVPAGHPAFHDDDLLALPRVQHWHARDGRAGLQRDRVHGVIRADDKRYVRVPEVIVDLVHLQDDCEEKRLPLSDYSAARRIG